MTRTLRVSFAIVTIVGAVGAQHPARKTPAIPPSIKAALDRISGDSLRGHLSFVASDALEGRNTPSRGLDIAAEYIAAQFRRAGLEPAGDYSYFQTANWRLVEREMDTFSLELRDGGETISVNKDQVVISGNAALSLKHAAVFKVDFKDAAVVPSDQLEGKVVITEIPDVWRDEPSRRAELSRARNEVLDTLTSRKAALVISVDRMSNAASPNQSRLIDPENRQQASSDQTVPMITVRDPKLTKLYDSMKPGLTSCEASLQSGALSEKPAKIRNVIGLLRGSDPELANTYVLVTAHYDHLGMRAGGEGDNIYNGANDDGSGTVSVIELASALSTLKPRPRRSIIFMTFFGEEKGLLGSRYYGRHPIVAIEKTVADINLEQVGRTDSSEGPQIANAALTGLDYSDVGAIMVAAGKLTGITVYKHAQNSDAFFGRSDNQALADQGVPAHTLCTAFVYPDYHRVGDHWEKIDYQNMARVDRMVALSLITIANNRKPPKWNEANPKAAPYVKAWRERHPN